MSKQINQIASLLNEMGMDKEDIGEVIELINDILEGTNYDDECSDDDISDDEIEDSFPKPKKQASEQPSRPQTAPQQSNSSPKPSQKQPDQSVTQKTQQKPPQKSTDTSSSITSIKGSVTPLSTAKVMDCIPVGGGVQTLVNRFVDFCKSKNVDPESTRKLIGTKLGKRTKIVDVNLYIEGSVKTADIIGCLKK